MRSVTRVCALAGVVMTSHALGQSPVFNTEGIRPLRTAAPRSEHQLELDSLYSRSMENARLQESIRARMRGSKEFVETFIAELSKDPEAKKLIEKTFPKREWKQMGIDDVVSRWSDDQIQRIGSSSHWPQVEAALVRQGRILLKGLEEEMVTKDPTLRDDIKCHGDLESALYQREVDLFSRLSSLGSGLEWEKIQFTSRILDLKQPGDQLQKKVQDEVFQCSGITYDAIDLRAQFGPTRDQGPRGTCVAHAVTDAFVAMGSRLGVAVNDLHPLGLALGLEDCKARSGWTDGRHHIRGRVHLTDKWPELGYPDLGYMDGSLIDEDLESLQKSGLMTVSSTHKDAIESVFDRMNNGLTQRLRFNARGAPACDFSDKVDLAHEHVKSFLGRLKKQGVIVPKPVPDWDWTTLWKDIPSKDVLEAKTSPCSLKDPKTVERLRSISKSLCQGYPIVSGSRFPKGSESFKNGRWTLMPPLPPEQKNVGHAMLLVGMERASPDHQGYLIFRNSWEKGQSYLRIPIDQVCSVEEAYVVRGQKEPKPLSRQQCRWMKNQQLICSPEAMIADEKPIGPASTASPQGHSKPGAAQTP